MIDYVNMIDEKAFSILSEKRIFIHKTSIPIIPIMLVWISKKIAEGTLYNYMHYGNIVKYFIILVIC